MPEGLSVQQICPKNSCQGWFVCVYFPTNKLLPQLPHFLSLWPSTLQEILDPYQSKRGHEKSY